jgi:hypothetical protein
MAITIQKPEQFVQFSGLEIENGLPNPTNRDCLTQKKKFQLFVALV